MKSIFLLQIVHPDDLDALEDTIIHDLEITDVRPPPSCAQSPSSPSPPFHSIQTFLLHPIVSTFLEPIPLTPLGPPRMVKLALQWLSSHSVPSLLLFWEPPSHPFSLCVTLYSSSQRMTPRMPAPSSLSPSLAARSTTSTRYHEPDGGTLSCG